MDYDKERVRVDSLTRPLVGVAELETQLEEADVVVIDCRHQLLDLEAGRRAYLEGHIPGACHAHMETDLARIPGPQDGRHPLPAPEDFVATLRHLGVCNRSWVVAYDDGSAAMAARLWWMLRWVGHAQVSVLDGGLAAWTAAGLPLEKGMRNCVRGDFSAATVHTDWLVETSELQALLQEGHVALIDARAADRFRGRVEPIDAVAGHVPGALNLPYERLLSADGRFAEPRILRQTIDAIAARRSPDEIVAMCGSGVTACHLLLGMEAAGLGMARLYAGSWSQWIRDPTRPVAAQTTN